MAARANLAEAGGASVFVFDIGGFDEPMRVVRFSGMEGISSLFEFQVELASQNRDIDLSQVVGRLALLAIRSDGGWRHLNGIVARFEQLGELPRQALYRATLVPLVWRLLHRHDCRIFQKLDTPAILKKVFEAAGVPSDWVSFNLASSYEPRDYCVQYRESDWAFVSRLMEEDGICYFFEHHEDKHVLVIGDGPVALKPIPGSEKLPFRRETGMVTPEDHVHRFRFTQEVRPGSSTLRDYRYKHPDLSMEAHDEAAVDADLQVYDYPGEYQNPGQGSTATGKTIARVRLESFQATRRVAQGQSDCERLIPGRLFTLAEHSRRDYNGRYLLTEVRHQGSQPQVLDEESQGGDVHYSNHFTCIVESVPYRPARVTPRPYVKGGQTAVVVGPAGEEIYVDDWGRVKVQFHWDRQGKLDENSSCWIRVSQLWAGEKWGGMWIPRIGQEVIVDFIEGDPDRPIITGRVYNGANLVPYELPAEKTKSTLKSNSSLGKQGYNELRFEDKKDQEQLFMHAERNMDVHVKNDSFENILHDRHQTIGSQGKDGKVGDQNELVYRDKSLTVHRHSQEHIGGNFKRLVGGVDGEGDVDIVIKADRKELVHKDSHLHIKWNLNEQVDSTQSLTVGKDLHVVVGQMEALEAGKEIHLKSSKIVIEAAEGLTWKGPGGFITIDPGGIAIKGNVVLFNSGGSALSGSGASPTAPEDAAEAMPTRPTLADDGMVRPPSGLATAQGGSEVAVTPTNLARTSLEKAIFKNAVAQAGTLLGPDGTFLNPSFENDYAKYFIRKTKQLAREARKHGGTAQKQPRSRAEWKVVSDYMRKESPAARGNRFNRTGRLNYAYNEVHLEGGRRLDSYVPPPPEPGEIISRKAIDFDTMDVRNFESHLQEMVDKYKPGTPIRSNKYKEGSAHLAPGQAPIDGSSLQGKMILEVPDSNKGAINKHAFERIAKNWKPKKADQEKVQIEIRYIPET